MFHVIAKSKKEQSAPSASNWKSHNPETRTESSRICAPTQSATEADKGGAPALPKRIENWSLTSLQQRLVKTGGRLVKHARYYWLLLAESHLTKRLFGSMLRRIAGLSLPAG